MTSVNAFNDMMGQFLAELHKTFPEERAIKKSMSGFELMRQSNPRLVVDGFMTGVAPYADKIGAAKALPALIRIGFYLFCILQ